MNTLKHIAEIEKQFETISKKIEKQNAEKLRKYIGTELHVYGVTSKSQSDIAKNDFSFIEDDVLKNFKIFDKIYFESNVFEIKNLSFIYLNNNHKYISAIEQIKILPKWIDKVDNWAHSDTLSKFLTRLLEHQDTQTKMVDLILKWNQSKNLWKRRQSLITLFYYSKTKKNYVEFEFAELLISKLITDKEYFVQKAVGWSLRECNNVYPKQTYAFIEKNIKLITSVAFTTCIEKMTLQEKNNLKSKRKK